MAEDDGRVVAAVLGRTSEQIDLVLDGEYSDPQTRWNLIVHMMSCGQIHLREFGIPVMHCFVPREIEKSYGRRLLNIGFEKEAGATFLKEV